MWNARSDEQDAPGPAVTWCCTLLTPAKCAPSRIRISKGDNIKIMERTDDLVDMRADTAEVIE